MDECLHSCKNAGCMTTSLCGWLCSLSLCERINAYSSRPASVRSKMSASTLVYLASKQDCPFARAAHRVSSTRASIVTNP